ncbi:MAG: hypothetical protein LBN95_00255 [Prevotellaceae bacterium]|jgi:hypothetical protein|nr:hypothetical protein [Prevotellaceae bacterium]
MTTLNVTLADNALVTALRNILLRINGVMEVTVVNNEIEVQNRKTLAAIKELNSGKGIRCKNVDELFDKLNS